MVARTTGRHAQKAIGDRRSDLRAVRARRELVTIEEAEAALAASKSGVSQREIAADLGRSQTDIHRLLRKSRAGMPSATWRTILRGVAGDGTRATMVGLLRPGLERGEVPSGEQTDGYVPSGLDEVRRAYMEGLLTEDEYNQIRGVAPENDESDRDS